MALQLLCDRPLFKNLDLQSARFVVRRGTVTVNGRVYQMGEEIPQGSLTPYALACQYERPTANIDELNYAYTVDGLREACVAHGVKLDAPQVVKPDLESMDRKALVRLCELYSLDATGTVKALRQRLEAFLG